MHECSLLTGEVPGARRRSRRRDGLTVRACAAASGINDQKGGDRPERSPHRKVLPCAWRPAKRFSGKEGPHGGARLRWRAYWSNTALEVR